VKCQKVLKMTNFGWMFAF